MRTWSGSKGRFGGEGRRARAFGNAGLRSLPANGGSPTGLVTNRSSVATFAIDSTHVAWFDLLDGEADVLGLFVMAR